MSECKLDNVDLLLFVMKPIELISKQFIVVVCSVMFSDVQFCYKRDVLSVFFSLCRWSIFDLSGTVSSNMLSFFFTGLMIKTSALSLNKIS